MNNSLLSKLQQPPTNFSPETALLLLLQSALTPMPATEAATEPAAATTTNPSTIAQDTNYQQPALLESMLQSAQLFQDLNSVIPTTDSPQINTTDEDEMNKKSNTLISTPVKLNQLNAASKTINHVNNSTLVSTPSHSQTINRPVISIPQPYRQQQIAPVAIQPDQQSQQLLDEEAAAAALWQFAKQFEMLEAFMAFQQQQQRQEGESKTEQNKSQLAFQSPSRLVVKPTPVSSFSKSTGVAGDALSAISSSIKQANYSKDLAGINTNLSSFFDIDHHQKNNNLHFANFMSASPSAKNNSLFIPHVLNASDNCTTSSLFDFLASFSSNQTNNNANSTTGSVAPPARNLGGLLSTIDPHAITLQALLDYHSCGALQMSDLLLIQEQKRVERQFKIERYKNKRRNWIRKISYDCRKRVADSRQRVKGRFISKKDSEKLKTNSADHPEDQASSSQNGDFVCASAVLPHKPQRRSGLLSRCSNDSLDAGANNTNDNTMNGKGVQNDDRIHSSSELTCASSFHRNLMLPDMMEKIKKRISKKQSLFSFERVNAHRSQKADSPKQVQMSQMNE